MDGSRFIFAALIFGFSLVTNSARAGQAQAPAPVQNKCDWSCGKVSAQTQNADGELKDRVDQVQEYLKASSAGPTTSCALTSSFGMNQNLALGAYQALAVANKNCALPDKNGVTSQNFLDQTFTLQGLKLFADKSNPPSLTPSVLFDMKDTSCLKSVPDNQRLQPGDILLSRDDALIVSAVNNDPFGIDRNLFKVEKQLNLGRDVSNEKITAKMNELCDKWLQNTDDYQITVYRAGGKVKLFPAMGHTSSLWIAAISERAKNQCDQKVSSAIIEASLQNGGADARKSSFQLPAKGLPPGLKVLRHNDVDSDSDACRLTRTAIPPSDDLTCVQCCKEPM